MSSVHAMSTGWSHIACSSWNFRKKWQGTWSPFEWKAWSSVTKAHSCWAKAEKLLNVLLFLYFGRKPRLNGRSNRNCGSKISPTAHSLTHSSHIQIYVSRLEFYDRGRCDGARSDWTNERAKPRASDSAAARKIFPIDSGHPPARRWRSGGGEVRAESGLRLSFNLMHH